MKKTVISLVLTLAMFFGLAMAATPQVQAAGHTDHCICGGTFAGVGEHAACTKVTWTELTADVAATPLSSGNYYLAANMELVNPLTIASAIDTVNICLNGYTLKGNHKDLDGEGLIGEQGVVFNLAKEGTTLNICDCKGTGVVESIANNAGACIFQAANNTVSVFGGTYKGATTTGSKAGATLRQATNANSAVFNMYGGVMTRGRAGSQGGNVAIYGTMNMYGGSIIGGWGKKFSGNLHIAAKGTVNIYDGTISGGTATDQNVKDDIYCMGKLTIHNMQESFYLKVDSAAVADLSKMDSSLSIPANADMSNYVLVTKTKTSGGTQAGGTPVTGDIANPVIVTLCMVIGATGMVCFVPKKRRA